MRLGSVQRIAASVSAQGRPCADPRSILVGGPLYGGAGSFPAWCCNL